jgi:hypothetical protein
MPFEIDNDVVETDHVKAYEDSNGTVIIEDKHGGNQLQLDDDVRLASVASHLLDGGNPHTTTLEQARSENNELSGPVDTGGNDLTNVGALDTDELNNAQYVSTEQELHDAGSAVDTSFLVNNIILTKNITLSQEFHPPTNSTNGTLWLNRKQLRLADGVNENVIHIEGGRNWEIRGPGIIDGNKANQADQDDAQLLHGINVRACDQFRVSHVTARDTLGDGMNIGSRADGAYVESCYVYDAGSADYARVQAGGIRVSNGHNATITQSVFEDCYGHWAIINGKEGGENIRMPSLTNCIGDGVENPDGPQSGFTLMSCTGGVLSNCTGRNVSAATTGGADVTRVEDFYNGVIIGCVGVGAPNAGVKLGDDAHDSMIIGCVGNGGTSGLNIGGQSDGCMIIGSRADNNTRGIHVQGGSQHFVAHNHVGNNDTAIRDDGTSTTITDNKGHRVRLIQSGVVNHADPGTPADGTWDSWTTDTQSVTFDTTFGAKPTVITSMQLAKGAQCEVNNVSTTGFDSSLVWYRSNASTGRNVFWIAVGQE